MKDLVSGVSISVLGIIITLMAREMRSPYPGFGPEVFPSAIGILLAIFGLILALQGFLVKGKAGKNGPDRRIKIVLITLTLTAVYIISLLWIPFLMSTPLYLMALILMGKSTKEGVLQRSFYPRFLAFSLVVSGLIYVVFRFIFHVALI